MSWNSGSMFLARDQRFADWQRLNSAQHLFEETGDQTLTDGTTVDAPDDDTDGGDDVPGTE